MITSEKTTRFSKSELAVLSHAIANTDELIQKLQALSNENRKLKQKYRSLSQSAVQVKQLYEQERDVGYKILCQNTEMKNKIATLTKINSELEHSRINMQLTHSQAIAEMELKNMNEANVLDTILKDLVFQCKDWSEGDSKFKNSLRQAVDLLEQRGVCIDKISIEKSKYVKKNRQKPDDSFSTFDCDTDMDIVKYLDEKDHCSCAKTEFPKAYFSIETNTEIKTFIDKSTTYTSSTTTRGVSTDCLVKKIDVGTNFPEIPTKNVTDIFREMIIDIPRLLSPISDKMFTVDQSTQTVFEIDRLLSNSPLITKPQSESICTSVKNMTTQTENYGIESEMERNSVELLGKSTNPQLCQLWISLGKLLFDLLRKGKIHKNSGENENDELAWKKIQELSNLIESRKKREKENSLKKNKNFLLYSKEDVSYNDSVLMPNKDCKSRISKSVNTIQNNLKTVLDQNDEVQSPLSEHCNYILRAKRKCHSLDHLLSPIKDLAVTQIVQNSSNNKTPMKLLNDIKKIDLLECTTELVDNRIDCLYESPKSPQLENAKNYNAPEIPFHRPDYEIRKLKSSISIWKRGNNTLNNIINNYDANKRFHIVQKSICKNSEKYQLSPLIETLRKSIKRYLQEPWSEKSVKNLHDECITYRQNCDEIIWAILEAIENCLDESFDMNQYLVAPALPLIHQKIIVLIEKFPKFIKKKILNAVNSTLFSFNTITENDNLRRMISLTYFYIALLAIDLCDENISNSRLFVYKALYYYNHRSFPLIYAILKVYPDCLPKRTTMGFDENPLVITFESILMNSTKDKVERPEFKKKELRSLLLTYYKYKPFKPSKDALMTELIERLKKHQLRNLDFSLILLAKRYGYEWAMTNLIKAHLYPYLEQLMIQSLHTDVHDTIIICCLRIISAILKTFPSNTDTTYFLQLFQTVLDRSQKPIIQEAAVEALLKLQRFGIVDIYQRIKNWSPHNNVSEKLNKMIITYIHRKDKKFWKKLNRTI